MPKTLSQRPARPAHRMQVASRDRRILMAGDALQNVQIDADVGHQWESGVPKAVGDRPASPKSSTNSSRRSHRAGSRS
jgi:hypothetical protein